MSDLLTLTQPLTGCLVSAQGTPDMTVAVALGSVLVGNAAVTVAAGNVTITAAAAAGDRIDAVVVDSTGAKSAIAGAVNDGANAQPPDTTGYALLAYVYVVNQASTQYTGTITADAITDKREFALIHTSPYRVTGLWYGVQGGGSAGATWTDQDMYLQPFFTAKNFAAQALGVRTAGTAGTAGSKARLGIYADDGSGGLSLLYDAGQVAIDGGVATPTIAISQTLTPGWWWLALAFQSLGATKPSLILAQSTLLSLSPIGGNSLTDISNGRTGAIKYSGISGALPTTPTSPTYSPNPVPGMWIQAA